MIRVGLVGAGGSSSVTSSGGRSQPITRRIATKVNRSAEKRQRIGMGQIVRPGAWVSTREAQDGSLLAEGAASGSILSGIGAGSADDDGRAGPRLTSSNSVPSAERRRRR